MLVKKVKKAVVPKGPVAKLEHPCPACGLEMVKTSESSRYIMFTCSKCELGSYVDKERR